MEKCNCGHNSWFFALFGIIFAAVGYLLWSGSWTIEQAIGAVIIVFGVKMLIHCCGPMKGKKRRR